MLARWGRFLATFVCCVFFGRFGHFVCPRGRCVSSYWAPGDDLFEMLARQGRFLAIIAMLLMFLVFVVVFAPGGDVFKMSTPPRKEGTLNLVVKPQTVQGRGIDVLRPRPKIINFRVPGPKIMDFLSPWAQSKS